MYIHTKVVYNIHEFIMLLKIKYIWNWLHVKRCEGWLICKSFILFFFPVHRVFMLKRHTGQTCGSGVQNVPFFFFARFLSCPLMQKEKVSTIPEKKKKIPQVHRSDLIHLPPALKSNVITFYESYNKIDFPYPHWGNSWSLTS